MATVILTNTWRRERVLAPASDGGNNNPEFFIDLLCKIHWMQIVWVASGTAGSRQIRIRILDGDSNLLWEGFPGSVQPNSSTYLYNLAPDAIRNAVAVEGQYDIPMPEITIPNKNFNGDPAQITVEDINAIDGAGDSFSWVGEFSDL